MFPLRTKDEALSKVKELVKTLRNQGLSVEYFRSDDGGGFRAMQSYFKEQGIQWEISAPYAQQQNGVAERSNRTILEKARTMLLHANLPKAHWAEALNTAVYLANRTPTSSLPDHKTPYEAWHGKKPDIQHLRVFGCTVWVVDHKPKGKMDPRGWRGTFMGYGNGKNQYRVWNGRTVLIRRDVVFDETVNGSNPPTAEENRTNIEEVRVQLGLSLEWEKGFTELPSTAQLRNRDRPEDAATNRPVRTDPTTTHGQSPEPEGPGDTHEQSSQPEGNEDTDSLSPQPDGNGDTQGIDDTRSDSDNESLLSTIVVDTSNVRSGMHQETPAEAPRRTGRITERRDYAQAHRRGFARTAQVKALEDDDPKSYEVAMSSHDQRHWLQAMEEELNSHEQNETWTVVPRPPNRKVLGGRWVFKTKTGLDGKIVRHKARWVVRGFEQIEGIDYDETYAAVVKPATCKVLFALAAAKGLKIEQMDVVTAFLYGLINEEVYVELPQGEEKHGREDSVCRLNKALYGLKQSPRVWYETLAKFLVSLGFVRSDYDHGLFHHKTKGIYITVYVDDLQIVGADECFISDVKKQLAARFKMKDLGPATHYLGMEIVRTGTALILRQTAHIEQVLKRHGMEDSNPVSTPLDANVRLHNADDDFRPSPESVTAFQSMLGSIMYIMCQSRPDIAHPVSQLSQYSARPDRTHWTALKRVLRYLMGTKELGITYVSGSFVLTGWTDSDWAGDLDDSKSTAGYVFLLAGGAISWASKKQPSVALSSTEAEYIAQKTAATEAVWLRGLLQELGLRDEAPTEIWADNQGAIKLASNPEYHRRTKHIRIQYHYTRECVASGEIKFMYVSTKDMAADGLTKSLPQAKFTRFTSLMGLK